MKKVFFTLAMLVAITHLSAQTSPIAHWDMNGTVNDVTGNGHNGIAHNITPAAGADGIAGHGYAFNGTNSLIYIPTSPELNMSTGFSICTRLKIQGFNPGTCHANTVFCHGFMSPIGTGSYSLYFSDMPAGIDCSNPVDTAQECFLGGACGTGMGLGPDNMSDFNYIPHIVPDTWYDVVVTFNDTAYRTYVNGIPMSTTYITTPGVHIGTFDTGASIGFDVFDSIAGYPYPFNGVIDDLLLYNYKLSDSAVHAYSNPTGVGVSAAIMERTFDIYPNPAKNTLYLKHANGYTATVFDITGKIVTQVNLNQEEQALDISQLPAGVYAARLNDNTGRSYTKRFLKE